MLPFRGLSVCLSVTFKIWVPDTSTKPTSRRVLPPGEYDRRYRQAVCCAMPDVIISRAMLPFAKLI